MYILRDGSPRDKIETSQHTIMVDTLQRIRKCLRDLKGGRELSSMLQRNRVNVMSTKYEGCIFAWWF
jgi:hypothetical protein